jgi:DNA-binding IclR family transcriptional regulator
VNSVIATFSEGQEVQPVSDQAQPTIKSVQRAATILSAFTVSNPRLTLNQLTDALGSTKATAHRYTMALREAKLVRYSERDTLFSLGPQVLTLSAAARAGMPIIAIAQPLIHELVQELNQTVVLSVWDGGSPVVVHGDDSADTVVQVSVRTGARLELEHSAQGRIFCAFLDPETEPVVKAALQASPEFAREMQQVRAEGVADNLIEVSGVRSIAVPVISRGTLVAALAVVGTSVAVPDTHKSTYAIRLSEVADLIAADLAAR